MLDSSVSKAFATLIDISLILYRKVLESSYSYYHSIVGCSSKRTFSKPSKDK